MPRLSNQGPDLRTLMRQVGLLTAIPFVLLVGPALGYYLGTALDRRWPYAPWGMGVGIVFGLVASARVTTQMIREAQQLNKPHKRDE